MNHENEYDEDPQEHTTEVVVPSNPADRKKLRGMLEEIVALLRKNEENRVSMKVIKDEIKKQFNLAPKYAGALAKTMYKDNFAEVKASQTDFEFLYDAVVRANTPAKASFSEDDVKAAYSEKELQSVLKDLGISPDSVDEDAAESSE